MISLNVTNLTHIGLDESMFFVLSHILAGVCFKDLEGSFRYPLARQGVFAPGGPDFLAHTRQRFSNIVGLTALRLAFFMGYE